MHLVLATILMLLRRAWGSVAKEGRAARGAKIVPVPDRIVLARDATASGPAAHLVQVVSSIECLVQAAPAAFLSPTRE